MPIDKFGRVDIERVERTVSDGGGGVLTITQANDAFLRRDGVTRAIGKLHMGGYRIEGLPTEFPTTGEGDFAISLAQALTLVSDATTKNVLIPTEDTHRTNKKYVDQLVASRVTQNEIDVLSRVNNIYLRRDGKNKTSGNLNMNGKLIKGLPTDYPTTGEGDFAISLAQALTLVTDATTKNVLIPTEDTHLTNKKYVDDLVASRVAENPPTESGDAHISVSQAITLVTDATTKNVLIPTEDTHLTNKKYVDRVVATKVDKNGDTIYGDLKISCLNDSSDRSDRLRTMGCDDLGGNKIFAILLGNGYNKIICRPNNPVIIQASSGIVCRQGGDTKIIILGKKAGDPRINVYQDIVMNQHRIVDLNDPVDDRDAVTKRYVEKYVSEYAVKVSRRNHTGYIPELEANESTTGFVASSNFIGPGYTTYSVFNSSSFLRISRKTEPIWMQIKCPKRVIVWRVELMATIDPLEDIQTWTLSASNDGLTFTPLLTSTIERTTSDESPTYFYIATMSAYQYCRLTMPASDKFEVFFNRMQLYIENIE